MSTVAAPLRPAIPQGIAVAGAMLALATLAAILAGWIPIQFSIATVFLFAGPHNWFEARYILGRLPSRAGKLFGSFSVSFPGIIDPTLPLPLIPSHLPARAWLW